MKVDISEVIELTRSARRLLARAPRELAERCYEAAEKERDTHRYQNRTGNLENNTLALPYDHGDEFGCDVVADTPYAGYVAARGLMRLDKFVHEADEKFRAWIERASEDL